MTPGFETSREADGRPAPRLPIRRGYGAVLTMISLTYVVALFTGPGWTVALLLVAQAATAWQALRISRARPVLRLAAAAVLLLALATVGVGVTTDDSRLGGLTFLAASVLYLLTPASIVRDIGFHRGVDRQTMLGALSAYLFIGMAFGFAYQCLARLQPGPLFGDGGDADLADTMFFSFVTMTTTGYGDLVPAGNPGQTLAILEALIGQLFLVTAVAKVVENWRPRRWRRDGEPAAEQPPHPGGATSA
jgi:hypothetical protein